MCGIDVTVFLCLACGRNICDRVVITARRVRLRQGTMTSTLWISARSPLKEFSETLICIPQFLRCGRNASSTSVPGKRWPVRRPKLTSPMPNQALQTMQRPPVRQSDLFLASSTNCGNSCSQW